LIGCDATRVKLTLSGDGQLAAMRASGVILKKEEALLAPST